MSWKFDINNDVGGSSVPISMKTLNKYDCDNICNLLETLSIKVKESGENVSQKDNGIKGSILSDGYFIKYEIRTMAENWVQVEDDPVIIDTWAEESIEQLENVTFLLCLD